MFAFEQQVPIDAAVYRRIRERLGERPAEGLLVHVAIEQEDATLRYLDIWRDREDCDRFTDEQLHPVVGAVLAEFDIHPAGEPPRHEVRVVDLWFGAVSAPVGGSS